MTIPNPPALRILPLDRLILHEEHDQQRTLPLVKRLRAAGILRNPPIVMALEDSSGRYMVLDGANRVTSLKEMEFPHIVAQVVEDGITHVGLQTWNHVVWGMDAGTLLSNVRSLPGLMMKDAGAEELQGPPAGASARIHLADGTVHRIQLPADLTEEVQALNGIVDSYQHGGALDRTSHTTIDPFKEIYPDLTALILFPSFDIHSVLQLAGNHSLLPTGITRFTVSPRALHLNYPMHELSSAKPLEYKENFLQEWLQERLKNKGVRYYAEATFLFDE